MRKWERALGGAFIILAAAVALNIVNTVRISALHGLAKHEAASTINLFKRLFTIISILLLSMARVTPHYLVLAILFSEVMAAAKAKKQVVMPPLKKTLGQWNLIRSVFREEFRYYFTDEAFRIVFFLDFFVLGLFVSSMELGIYSEASVLARLFLIVPLGAAPLFRIRFYKMASDHSRQEMFRACRRTAARLFYWHSMMGLSILLAFPVVLRSLFPIQNTTPAPFHVFSILFPGLLFFGAASILEPVYTVQGKSAQLGMIALGVFILNAFLNLYFIPYSGINGAAAATTVSLLIYFFASGRRLDMESRLPRGKYLTAGGIVYLSYVFFSPLKLPGLLIPAAMALVLSVLFYLTGFFEEGEGAD